MDSGNASDLIVVTSDIVSAFVSNNTVRLGEMPQLIAAVHNSLSEIKSPTRAAELFTGLKPAVPIKKSITEDNIICLDDGKKFKSLKRHLAALGMTPVEYRTKWGLPKDYPMVAPGYASLRSKLARTAGLGRKAALGATPAKKPEPVVEELVEAPAKKRGRPKKAA